MSSIILLSGPVGAGRSTVAPALVAAFSGPVVYIEGDMFWSFIARASPRHKRQHNFRMIMLSMVAAAIPCAKSGYETILDFSIPPWFLDTVLGFATAREIPVHYVALCPSETMCAARAASRPAGTIADYSPYQDLYADFDRDPRTTLRGDDTDPAALAARIRTGLDAGEFRL